MADIECITPSIISRTDIECLSDRLLSRAVSTLSTYCPREKEDLLIASRSIRELLRVYERATGRQLSSILLCGGA
jgi:hypothetical protein